MGWFESAKRYVWDEEKTPQLIPFDVLSKSQARKELFVYTLSLSITFALIAIVAMAGAKSGANFKSFGMAFYAFSVFCGAVVLGMNKFHAAALYVASAPLAAMIYIFADGAGAGLVLAEKIGLLVCSVIWFRYALRIVAIAKAYPDMREESEQP